MDHFKGVSERERYDNAVLNELRAIRELLERNAQAVEQPKETIQRRGRRKGVVNQ